MRTSLFLVSLLAAAQGILAANSPCAQKCVEDNPTLSWCNGDEKGKALADCTCQSFNSNPSIPDCVKAKCSKADQAAYATTLPKECRSFFFPNADASPSESTASGSQSSGMATNSPSTASGAQSSGAATSAPSTTMATSAAGSASTAAGSSSTSTGAATHQTPVAIAGAILAALFV